MLLYSLLISFFAFSSCHINFQRVIVIGDIHGSYEGLLELLKASKIIESDTCSWNPSTTDTLLVQVGDIVDRGPHPLQAYNCLGDLQKSAPEHSSGVYRLVGNHDIWWLEGYYDHIHENDSDDIINSFVSQIKADILSGKVATSQSLLFNQSLPLFFVHGGLSPEYYDYISRNHNLKSSDNEFLSKLSTHANSLLYNAVNACPIVSSGSKCVFKDKIFAAGKERGGGKVGGLFWTDFSVLERNIASGYYDAHIPRMIQIVGHTMAHGDKLIRVAAKPETLKTSEAEAVLNVQVEKAAVVPVVQLPHVAFAVDAGMVYGRRGYLSIDMRSNDAVFTAHEKKNSGWRTRVLLRLQPNGRNEK